jgi:hypothetical protein
MVPMLRLLVLLVPLCLSGRQAFAQEISQATREESTAESPNARLRVGVGVSSPWGEGRPAALLSIQLPLASHVRFEAEATRRSLEFENDVTTIAGHLLFHVRTNRVSTFAGGGLGMQRTTGEPVRLSIPFGCAPSHSSFCQLLLHGRDTGFIVQTLGGAEIWLTPRVGAFGALHAGTAPEHGLRVFAGVRTGLFLERDAQTSSPPRVRAIRGKEIRVTAANGQRQTGRLVELTNAEVSFALPDELPTVLPLQDVRKIETVSHHARTGALIGAVSGAVMIALAYLGDCVDCEDRRVTFFYPGAFAGVGAAIGGMINAATADRHVVYEAGSKSVSLRPALSRAGAGANLSVSW